LGLFTDLNSQISLAFLERYPSPADARGLGEQRLAAFLARERYCGRQQSAQLLAKLRRAPEGRVGELELAARRQLVLTLVAMLKQLRAQITQLERQIATAVRRHPDGEIFLSLFKGSTVIAAEMVAEIGDCRARYPDPRRARRRRRSGRRGDRVGQAEGRPLSLGMQQAAALIALHAGRQHPPLAPVGRRPLRPRDRSRPRPPPRDPHPRPCLVPRDLALLIGHPRCCLDRVPYDPARHRALQQHCTVLIPITSSGPCPDLAATQRMLGGAVTDQAARRAKREALDGKPTSATTPGG
jgi:hypothetical protein